MDSGKYINLTVTRACNLRCSYCPTVKEGWPSLSEDDAVHAVRLFARRYGGGDIKMFGGEPLLVPNVVRAAMEAAADEPAIRRVYVSTNGLGLDEDWLMRFRKYPKGILTISMDGKPEDHRRYRRKKSSDIPDTYEHVVGLLPVLRKTPRVVVTQTIPPASVERAADNFRHLRELGFTRFNLLPGYYLPWREPQLVALRTQFQMIAGMIRTAWENDESFYLRNLFTRAPTPFFNSGLVVDADRTIHPSNVGLSGALDDLRSRTQVGDLDTPPTPAELAARSALVNDMLQDVLPARIWESTLAVDSELTRFCRGLYKDFAKYRERKGDRRVA